MNSNPLLSIIGTPIGNLKDISKRVIDTLESADTVFAEDTRTALNLLNHLGLKKRILSCYKDNEHAAVEKILQETENGKKVALISEAGMPCISDPGAEVVKTFIENNIPFEIVQGPTALIHGLIASGFSGSSFFFYGFLPHKVNEKKKAIENIKNIYAPIIFYESPHRVKETLKLLLEHFPAPVACSRELTKLYEETIFIQTEEDIEKLTIKGEFVLTVNNKKIETEDDKSSFNPSAIGEKLLEEGFSAQDTVKILKILGVKRNDAYKIAVNK